MEDAAYYLSFLVTFSLCLFLVVILRNKYKSGKVSCQKAKMIYSFSALFLGLFSGTVIFHSLAWLFNLSGYSASYGHGEILFAAIFFNTLLSLFLLAVGRVVIGWQKQTW